MNKNIKQLIIGAALGAGFLAPTSCDVLDLTPEDYFSAQSFWKDQSEFEGFITALSNQFRGNYPANILFYAGELRAGTLELYTIDGSGTLNTETIQNIYDQTNSQFSNFGGYYGFIANLNELIYQCGNTDVLSDEIKNGLLGMAYGWRAYAYFQMYRMYGGLVLRLEPNVTLGQYDPTQLYKARSSAEETLAQIKQDIDTSLEHFNSTSYVFKSDAKDYYWSKACTEMLAGEVYLWSGKVATDDHAATPADVATAATYFNNVINNYGYALQKDFFAVWTDSHNSESIYSICYSDENDGAYYTYPPYYFLWARTTGAAYMNYWSTQDKNGWGHAEEGVANLFGRWHDPETGETSDIEIWSMCNFGPMRYLYKNALYYQFDKDDSRINMFYPQWYINDDEYDAGLEYLEDFDPKEHDLAGTFVCKFRPKRISSSNYYTFADDMPIYRLALAYLYAAECANYLDNNADVEKYINLIRQRAYGDKWDESLYGYKAGTFAENENAIMREKDKEFVMEGQRWWDLRRLTTVKNGTQKDHFVFQPQGCVGYGLDPQANPWMVDGDGYPVETDVPVLDGTSQDEHLLLWPINAGVINSDPEIKQNPGY